MGGGYGVIDLEAQQNLGGGQAEGDDERCSRGLRRLADGMDHLHTLLDGVTGGQHQAAHTMLRLGFERQRLEVLHDDLLSLLLDVLPDVGPEVETLPSLPSRVIQD